MDALKRDTIARQLAVDALKRDVEAQQKSLEAQKRDVEARKRDLEGEIEARQKGFEVPLPLLSLSFLYTHACTHTYTHARTRAHTHTHTHTGPNTGRRGTEKGRGDPEAAPQLSKSHNTETLWGGNILRHWLLRIFFFEILPGTSRPRENN